MLADFQKVAQVRRKAFSHANGNASKAAESLGISRATFYRKLKKYGISE
ncbi:MAG: hypothetical protein HGB04_10225 [Chlorobiaceae bacterium]|nr:hypothetical protein [Chlorobiaceae bacterium]